MARVWTCGFEENNIGVISGTPVPPTIVTSPVRSGVYSAHINPSAVTLYVQELMKAAVTSGTHFFRIGLYINSLPSARCVIAEWNNSGGSLCCSLWLETSGVLTLTSGPASQSVATLSSLTIQTWYYVEATIGVSPSGSGTGVIELRLNGTVQNTVSNIDTMFTDFQGWIVGNHLNTYTYDIYVDDLAWNDSTGATQNTYPGDGRIAGIVQPASDVTVGFVKAGSSPAATNWGGVDDLPGVFTDATTYNDNQASIKEDRMGISTLPAIIGSADTMVLMHISGRVGSNASGTRNLLFEVWDDGGTRTQGPTCSCALNGWRVPNVTENLFVDLTGKTKSQVQNYNIGYTSTSSNTMRVTTLWANIEYMPAAVTPDIITLSSPLTLVVA